MSVQFATFQVEVVRGYSYNQIVSEFLGPFEKIYVPLMKQVEGSVCYDFFHYCSSDSSSWICFARFLSSSSDWRPMCDMR